MPVDGFAKSAWCTHPSMTLLQKYCAALLCPIMQPEDQPNPLFRHLWEIRGTTGECQMCQFLARHRADPKPSYTTCLFDRDW